MNAQLEPVHYKYFVCKPMTGALGAEVEGVQLNGSLSAEQVAELKQVARTVCDLLASLHSRKSGHSRCGRF